MSRIGYLLGTFPLLIKEENEKRENEKKEDGKKESEEKNKDSFLMIGWRENEKK